MRKLKSLVGTELAVRLKQTLQQKAYDEEGGLVEDTEVNSVLYGTLLDIDSKFLYLGDDSGVQLIINLDSVSVMTSNPHIIAEWIGDQSEDLELAASKEELN